MLGVALFFYQRQFLYYPTNNNFEECPHFSSSEKITYQDTNFYYRERSSERVAVFYHGNASSACDMHFLHQLFSPSGYSYLLVEFPGYAQTPGNPTQENLSRTVKQVNDFIEEKNYSEVVLLGQSIGTGLASEHSRIRPRSRLALVSPFEKFSSLIQEKIKIYPGNWLLRDKFNNLPGAQAAQSVLIIHGKEDQLIPPHHAQKLFEKIKKAHKEILLVENFHHNDIFQSPQTHSKLREFLRK